MLCLASTFLDVLVKMIPASKIFEGEGHLAFDVKNTVDLSLLELQDCPECAGTEDEFLDSSLPRFQTKCEDDSSFSLASNFLIAGEALKKADQCKTIRFEFQGMKHLSDHRRMEASSEKIKVIGNLCEILKERLKDFEHGIHPLISVFDPKNWKEEKEFGCTMILELASHFKTTLSVAGYDKTKFLNEWKMLQKFITIWLKKSETADLWKHILTHNSFAVSGSNSSVERAFSMLTNMLSYRRLSMKHKRMKSILKIAGNDKNWSAREKKKFSRGLSKFI